MIGKTVLLRGHAHAIKSMSHGTFVILRQRTETIQVMVDAKDMKAFVDIVPVESVVDVEGTVVAATVKGTTMNTVEIKPTTFFVVQAARYVLPFQPREAERPPPEEDSEEAQGKKQSKNVLQEMRLDHRTLDLRTPAMQAISRISDSVCRLFAEFLRSQGFVEIMTPKLLAGTSEGGAEVFRTDYFGQVATLAQSPQLHKQMCAACSGFERVFEIGPVFRAEKSLTVRHMTEFHGLDVEMAIYEHYHEMLDMFSELFFYIFDGLNRDNRRELEVVRQFCPFQDLVYRRDPNNKKERALVLTFQEAVEMLAQDIASGAAGHITPEELAKLRQLDGESDPPTPVEKRLGALIKAKYGVDFYMLDK
jgi:aspartyl-tRNA synthetase